MHIVLNLIGHVACFSAAAAAVKSKDRIQIIKHIFGMGISTFGAPSKNFSDNGGEFSNENYNDMWDSYKIMMKKNSC